MKIYKQFRGNFYLLKMYFHNSYKMFIKQEYVCAFMCANSQSFSCAIQEAICFKSKKVIKGFDCLVPFILSYAHKLLPDFMHFLCSF